ncbi:MAG: DUF6629 family protein [Cyanobacteriota bacterium]|nr:DUF6629 family protein [Cyanobacteriota bacterium]
MCFSATASVLASGALVTVGAATLALPRGNADRHALPLALVPLLFGVQQGLEGRVWLGIAGHAPAAGGDSATVAATLAYLFFAYAFWPVWMPWAAVSLLPGGRGQGLRWLPLLGLVPGLTLWLPLLSDPAVALPARIGHALVYPLHPWSQTLLPPWVGPALYAAWIVGPLLLVPSGRVRAFALTLLLAFALTEWAHHLALTSVWCYASALLSGQILWILRETAPAEPSPAPTLAPSPLES